MQKILDNLRSLTSDDLNVILDKRDSPSFDDAWCELYELSHNAITQFNTKDIFIEISKITNHHDICSYISDDLELMNKCQIANINSDFFNYLKNCYQKGSVPCEWCS